MAVLGLDGRGFKAGLKEAEVGVAKFAQGMKGQIAGAFSSAAMLAYMKNVVDAVGRIKDLSEQFRITTDEVQQTDAALKRQGLRFEDLQGVIGKLAAARREAVEKDGDARASFKELKVGLEDLNNPFLRHYDLLLKIANATDTKNMTAREEAELLELLGIRSLKLLSSLREIGNMQGVKIIDEDTIGRIDRAAKAAGRLKDNIKAIAADRMNTAILFFGEGVGLTTDNEWERTAAENARPMSKKEVAERSAREYFKQHQKWLEENEGLFDVGKDDVPAASTYDTEMAGRASYKGKVGRLGINAPSLPGLAQSGGFSGGIASLDPSLFIQQNQLSELKAIKAELKVLQTIVGGKLGASSGLLGMLTR